MLKTLAYLEFTEDKQYRKDANLICLLFIILALTYFISTTIQTLSWKRVAEGLTMRLRTKSYEKILNKEA